MHKQRKKQVVYMALFHFKSASLSQEEEEKPIYG